MTRACAILPPATLGLLGGGQLGRMFALAAQRMGYRVHVYAPEADPPAAHVANRHVRNAYDDADALRGFAREVSAITYEFENVPADALLVAGAFAPVRPGAEVLATVQSRGREKSFLAQAGFPLPPFRLVDSAAALAAAANHLGLPMVVKTDTAGYDGKGQVRVDAPAGVPAAWASLRGATAVCEAWVDFAAELSVVVARGADGEVTEYGPFLNHHERHTLNTTVFPAPVTRKTQVRARALARAAAEALDVVGVLCVEFFLQSDGRLLINELAPRPHNSGHLTIEAHLTSQFEQQVRALCGLPLGSARPRSAAAMVNLLGDLWAGGAPAWERVLARPGVHLHLYGKDVAQPGRKMGHLTVLASGPEEARSVAEAARRALRPEDTAHDIPLGVRLHAPGDLADQIRPVPGAAGWPCSSA